MKTRHLSSLIAAIAIAVLSACSGSRSPDIPEATATAAGIVADTTGHYYGKDVAVTGPVQQISGGVVVLGEPGAQGVECYMKAGAEIAPRQTVTIRGICRPGDRGPTIDNAVLTSEE